MTSTTRVTDDVETNRLARIYAAEIARLVALGRLLTGDPASGEDLAHDVFLQATRKSRESPGYLREPAWPWLRTALVRAAGRRRRRALDEIRRLVSSYERPREEAELPDAVIDCVAALRRLPPRMRACAVLHYVEDLGVNQIAVMLECSPRTVENQLSTARLRLAPMLADDAEPGARPAEVS
ncbi:MAG TPA: sigma-70 family RNA polymerase sigma factor [Candidatus Dormibacteraeota bacterium]|jgi:RNA polymerase sigma-70 factor (ECF subfamily)|nr:sigma-70 family RNA polymerase sigma factor [Candidatus Dormibacteraeota bacterium]